MIMSVVKAVDRSLLNNAIQRCYRGLLLRRWLKNFDRRSVHKLVVHYHKNDRSLLSQLCDEYGSDKGEIKTTGHPYPWPSHTYADFYSRLFDHCRHGVKRVFECGLGTSNPDLLSSMGSGGKPGASLRVWKAYFPNAQIVGADIDRGTLFEEDRIRTFFVDQTRPETIVALWEQAGAGDFDVMVDDGLHTFEAGRCLFENSIARLSPHGIYAIEDVPPVDLLQYQQYFHGKDYVVDYVNLHRPELALADNSLVVIRRS
jgi:hypothetical protein